MRKPSLGQLSLFDPPSPRKPAPPTQPSLGFKSFVESGRRGNPNSYWLDCLLESLRDRGCSTPTLTQTQAAWDARLKASDAADAIAGNLF
jgi:hypothetical protein